MKFLYSVIFAVSVYFVYRSIAYAFNLDSYAKDFAAYLTGLPTERLRAAGQFIAGFIGLAALVAAIVFDPWTRILDAISPRPDIGTFVLVPDATFHLTVDRASGKTSAELHVDLVNQSDRLIQYTGTLRATVNGKDLDAPIVVNGYAAAKSPPSRLLIRMADVPMIDRPEATMKYDLTYSFGSHRRTRHTTKGIQWQTVTKEIPPTKKGPVERTYKINTVYYDQLEE